MTHEREQSLVELVSLNGESLGSSTVEAAHTGAGQLHRAFSVLLFDAEGRTLLQRRSAAKTRFPLRWANACCGHPAPGEAVVTAASRRLAEELGVSGVDLVDVGVLTYAASDPATGRMEHEYDHVLVGHVRSDLATNPDPDEVDSLAWVAPAAVLNDVTGARSAEYAPWLPGVLHIALGADGGETRYGG
jgi:isopentenyl-diphosphate delta-isomerase